MEVIDWTKIEAYAGPLRYTQIELMKMCGLNIEYILSIYPDD